jgi:hypothetical protein
MSMFGRGKGSSVPRHLRNPRRGYDAEGRELTPATVANSQQNGARGITARCACNHEAMIPFEKLRQDEFVPDIALRLRCTACGGKRIETYPDWSARWGSGAAGPATGEPAR